MTPTVYIDSLPGSVANYPKGTRIVVVDVIRTTTTAVTAVAGGRRCLPVASLGDAERIALSLSDPLLAGELGGYMPYGFHMTNSPAAIAARDDVHRPMILLSSSGTPMLVEAERCGETYAACLRNYRAQAHALMGSDSDVVVVGAGTRGVFREEDQIGCAWIAALLIDQGWRPGGDTTSEIIHRWRDEPPEALLCSRSVQYLAETGQLDDLDFILEHIDDLNAVFVFEHGELSMR